ncbi:hypothetical protein [Maribellus sediminis]|uniref:hypothetical protein n=1 Tax=Maribellus sediminis TaxID=2696285 RepID=UPI0014319011|nr:hypothetical protein [Maribellus sediminis]
MKELFKKYAGKGRFDFSPDESLKDKCNAPTDKSGVYLIYKLADGEEKLIYIGSSGQKNKDGSLKTRKSGLGGMKDRLVNGYHPKFGKVKRKIAWPNNMKKQGISKIVVYWWVTFDNQHSDFPTDMEKKLTNDYFLKFGCLPEWHK